jgi:hypothetical protein
MPAFFVAGPERALIDRTIAGLLRNVVQLFSAASRLPRLRLSASRRGAWRRWDVIHRAVPVQDHFAFDSNAMSSISRVIVTNCSSCSASAIFAARALDDVDAGVLEAVRLEPAL